MPGTPGDSSAICRKTSSALSRCPLSAYTRLSVRRCDLDLGLLAKMPSGCAIGRACSDRTPGYGIPVNLPLATCWTVESSRSKNSTRVFDRSVGSHEHSRQAAKNTVQVLAVRAEHRLSLGHRA